MGEIGTFGLAVPVIVRGRGLQLAIEVGEHQAGKVRAVKGYLLERTGISSRMMQTTGYWKRGVDADRFGKEKQQNPL